MKKKCIATILATTLVIASLAACGKDTDASDNTDNTVQEQSPTEESPAVEENQTPTEDNAADETSVAGTYTFLETSDMGESLWTLILNEDGTYSIEQDNPFGDKTVGEGTYMADGDVVYCSGIDASAFHGAADGDAFADRLMGGFVGDDNSTTWVINEDGTMYPEGMEPSAAGVADSVSGTYTYVETSDMGESLWTLILNDDGTYSIEQDNPFDDKTVGEGTYTADGNTISCSGIDAAAFHAASEGDKFADRLMGGFVGDDNSTTWTINADGTMEPVE